MDPETIAHDKDEQRLRLEEMIRRKIEVEKHQKLPNDANADKEVYRYEELIRSKNKKSTTKERVFNTAFCVEIKKEEERVMHILKNPLPRPDGTKFDQLIERERKNKREETRLAQDRLKMIDKKTRYSEFVREILSPVTKAKNSPEPDYLPRSSSKREILPYDDKDSAKGSEQFRKTDDDAMNKRLKPRSLSRKDFTPLNSRRISNRSPFQRQTITPVKGALN